MTSKIYDILGVGFGPGNLALAIALEELPPWARCALPGRGWRP